MIDCSPLSRVSYRTIFCSWSSTFSNSFFSFPLLPRNIFLTNQQYSPFPIYVSSRPPSWKLTFVFDLITYVSYIKSKLSLLIHLLISHSLQNEDWKTSCSKTVIYLDLVQSFQSEIATNKMAPRSLTMWTTRSWTEDAKSPSLLILTKLLNVQKSVHESCKVRNLWKHSYDSNICLECQVMNTGDWLCQEIII